MATKKLVPIPGSNKKPFRGAKVIATAPSDERLEVTVRIRPRNPLPEARDMLKLSAEPMRQLTHEQYEKSYGASAKDIALVKKFAKEQNLSVVRVSAARRSVILAGTVVDFNRAFGVSLKSYAYSGGTYRGRTGSVKVPADLAPLVEGVFGLDNRPAVTRLRALPRAAVNSARPFAVSEVVKLYNFPAGFDGSGQTIGIIELGGGYRPADLDSYFSSIGLATPTVIPVSVDGGTNDPTTVNSQDQEVALDIQVAGAAAPGAKLVVYFGPGPGTNKQFLDALTKAIHDTENNPSIISISMGNPEDIPTTNFQTQFNQCPAICSLIGHYSVHRFRRQRRGRHRSQSVERSRSCRFSGIESLCAFLRWNPPDSAKRCYLSRIGLEPEGRGCIRGGGSRRFVWFGRGWSQWPVRDAGLSATSRSAQVSESDWIQGTRRSRCHGRWRSRVWLQHSC